MEKRGKSNLRSGKLLFFIINHRAKRGGSLFEGCLSEEEESRSDPVCAASCSSLQEGRLNVSVFREIS